MIKLGSNIFKYRREKNMSQSQLAEKLYVTPQAVSRWERGVTEPDISTLIGLSKALDVSVDDLVGAKDSILSYNFRRISHVLYLLGSIFMIAFSLFLITTYFWQAPKAIYNVFIVCALIFLISILVLEIIGEVKSRRARRGYVGKEKTAKEKK